MKRGGKITVDIFFDFSNPYSYVGIKIFRKARDIFQLSNPHINIITLYHSNPTLPFFKQASLISTLKKTNPDEFNDFNTLAQIGKKFGCFFNNWVYHSNSFPAFLLLKATPKNYKESLMDDVFNSVFEQGENIADDRALNNISYKYKISNWGFSTISNVIGQYDVTKKHYHLRDLPRFVFDGKKNLYGIVNIETFIDYFQSCV